MTLPDRPVTLSVEQIAGLNQALSNMRHDINNYLSLVLAASELIRVKPEMVERMAGTLGEQPARIEAAVRKFSATFESTFGIVRG